MTYLVSRPHTWVTRQEDYMKLDRVPASYAPGPWEVEKDELDGLHDAIEEEFEFLIRDPVAIESAFADGFQIDAICASVWAQMADSNSPTFYEAIGKRLEVSLRRKVWEFAEANVRERSEP